MHAEAVQATVRAANYLSSYELVEDLRGRREDTPTGTFTAWTLPSCDVWDGGTACDQKLGCVEEVLYGVRILVCFAMPLHTTFAQGTGTLPSSHRPLPAVALGFKELLPEAST